MTRVSAAKTSIRQEANFAPATLILVTLFNGKTITPLVLLIQINVFYTMPLGNNHCCSLCSTQLLSFVDPQLDCNLMESVMPRNHFVRNYLLPIRWFSSGACTSRMYVFIPFPKLRREEVLFFYLKYKSMNLAKLGESHSLGHALLSGSSEPSQQSHIPSLTIVE